MMRIANYLTLVLPILGLGGLWGWSDFKAEQGTDWLVPIAGYDPRDLLRGHYIQYSYDWPGIDEEELRAIVQILRELTIQTSMARMS